MRETDELKLSTIPSRVEFESNRDYDVWPMRPRVTCIHIVIRSVAYCTLLALENTAQHGLGDIPNFFFFGLV